MHDRIVIRNARQNNLKGIDVTLPRRALVVLTGPSGSGKSSLAFDTLYAEGQRRYVESLSTYAKQFLERMEKPLVDSIEGISPAVAIEQKNPTKTSRSTVGTATEAYDYLRLLWARAGRTHCPVCDRHIIPDTVQSATDAILDLGEGTRLLITFPLSRSERVSHDTIVENLRALGFQRVRADGSIIDLQEALTSRAAEPGSSGETLGQPANQTAMDLASAEEVLVVVDRWIVRLSERDRLADSIGTAMTEGEGEVVIVNATSGDVRRFTDGFRCPDHPEIRFQDPAPRLFSFNNPDGACAACSGFGATLEYDPALIVPNPARSLDEGAVDPWEKPRYSRWRRKLLKFAKEKGIDIEAPWHSLAQRFRTSVLEGVRGFTGVIPFLRSREPKKYKQYIRVFLRRYQTAVECPECAGRKLRREALWVRVGGLTIAQASNLPIRDLRGWIETLDAQDVRASQDAQRPCDADFSSPKGVRTGAAAGPPLTTQERGIAASILRELRARLRFLDDVGVGYLTLQRQARTLSGGEAQRIALANSLGSNLVDTLYVLDEPTVGLHPRDTDRLLRLLAQLKEAGNTVVVVEHDAAAIRAADHIVELGPGSGEKGGAIVFQGTFDELVRADTATGRFLNETAPPPAARRPVYQPRMVRLRGARLHNLHGIDIEIPVGLLTVVTGVSGSGKSTLIHDVFFRAIERVLAEGETTAKRHLGEEVGEYDDIEGAGEFDAAVLVDQAPIGKTFRSNPVTYIKAFDHIREVFAAQPLARKRGYRSGHFSFNVKGGRCEACQGEGWVQIEMVFLADVYVPCEICAGKRYRPETLEVTYKDRNIREVLDLTVDEAIRFFIREDRLGQMLWQLQQVGLGYLRIGQPAPTLSGGEAQRLKIARELIGAGKRQGRRLYIMDEPTTGLSGAEVRKLLAVLRRLTDVGHTIVVIEHNLDVIRAADWIIDLGPDAGDAGGRVVAMGHPLDIADIEESHTARYLRSTLGRPTADTAGR